MSKVKVMTDSVSSITPELAREYNIKIVPAANIDYDGKMYPDGVSITPAEAYRLLEKNPDKFSATTLSPGEFMAHFREANRESNDLIYIGFSSALSGTYKLLVLAAEQYQKDNPNVNIKTFDSKTTASAQGLLAIAASRAAAAGLELNRVLKVVEKARPLTGGIMMLDTLRYVYRTGRMSKTAARLVSLLNIKPINRMTDEGTLELVDRVRKREDGYRKIMELIRKEAGTEPLHFIVSHADSPEIGDRASELLKENFDCLSLEVTEYSPIMGYAAGPRCLFIGFQPEIDFQNIG
jgi:DegV family protein with EDD domain